MKLTIAYMTARSEPHFEWFFSSLAKQIKPEDDYEVLVIDYFMQECDGWTGVDIAQRRASIDPLGLNVRTPVPPKPNVWQGPHRLTKDNYWGVANARNTAICLAKGDYIVFTDDRGVLAPGWMIAVRRAIETNTVLCGSYKKVADLVVEDGEIKGQGDTLAIDPRTTAPRPGDMGAWVFGCGTGLPIQWALAVNGYDEDCDGMGYEDVVFGLMLSKNGYPITYDPTMVLVEDRTAQGSIGPTFKRWDPGISPWDKSHAMLNMVMGGARVKAPNYFGPGGITEQRRKIQAGEPFPVMGIPDCEWFTGLSLKHLHELKGRHAH